METGLCRTRPNLCSHFIRCTAAEYAIQKPDENLTRLSLPACFLYCKRQKAGQGSTVKLWNCLPPGIVACTSLGSFKCALKDLYLT